MQQPPPPRTRGSFFGDAGVSLGGAPKTLSVRGSLGSFCAGLTVVKTNVWCAGPFRCVVTAARSAKETRLGRVLPPPRPGQRVEWRGRGVGEGPLRGWVALTTYTVGGSWPGPPAGAASGRTLLRVADVRRATRDAPRRDVSPGQSSLCVRVRVRVCVRVSVCARV